MDKEVRAMPASQSLELCTILDMDEGWKAVMSSIMSTESLEQPKYSMEHINMVEKAGEQQRRSCSEILLEEWGCSGREQPKYSDLLHYLVQCQLFRAADYVHHTLLQRKDELERPTGGPAARVGIPDPSSFSLATPKNLVDSVKSQLTATQINCSSPDPVFSTTLPVSKLSGLPKEFKFSDLKQWSGGFSKKLGKGAFGSVYLCNLPENGIQVAVKRLRLDNGLIPASQLPNQFHTEIATLSMFTHPNVLSLVGYCCDGPELCLIYDYMPNGSLQDKIQEGKKDFNWGVRLRIAESTAQGINYLHNHSDKPHIHRDIKSANILLDQHLVPKLGDFGLARPAPVSTIATTTIVGTTAYMSSEALRGDISVKMDVYSFGVVLLELVTGILAWDENRENPFLVSYIDEIEDISTLIDMRPEIRDDHLALQLYSISQQCLQYKKQLRPNIQQVLQLLVELSST